MHVGLHCPCLLAHTLLMDCVYSTNTCAVVLTMPAGVGPDREHAGGGAAG